MRVISHFPDQAFLRVDGTSIFQYGQTIETWLRPFEIAMWEIIPEGTKGQVAPVAARQLPTRTPDIQSHRLVLKTLGSQEAMPNMPGYSGLEINYGPPLPNFRSSMNRPTLDEFEHMGFQKRIWAEQNDTSRLWGWAASARHRAPFQKRRETVEISATGGSSAGQSHGGRQPILRFETVPNFRQTENNEWCPWLVFKIRTSMHGQEKI